MAAATPSKRLRLSALSAGLVVIPRTILVLLASCDPNVVIGAKWYVEQGGRNSETGAAGALATGNSGGGGSGGAIGDNATDLAGASGADQGGATAGGQPIWCATAPWLNTPATFMSATGSYIPSGSYVIRYESGAQLHQPVVGYEVTAHYTVPNGLQAGHHIYSGESVETGATSLWLDDQGLVTGSSVAEVENSNRGHTWPLEHSGGELHITLYDNDYHDNLGPGSRLCVSAAVPLHD